MEVWINDVVVKSIEFEQHLIDLEQASKNKTKEILEATPDAILPRKGIG